VKRPPRAPSEGGYFTFEIADDGLGSLGVTQKQLVRATFAKIAPICEQAAAMF
jgi:hypothetical protein